MKLASGLANENNWNMQSLEGLGGILAMQCVVREEQGHLKHCVRMEFLALGPAFTEDSTFATKE